MAFLMEKNLNSGNLKIRRTLFALLLFGGFTMAAIPVSEIVVQHKIRHFTTDVFGNLYVVDFSNTVFKYDRDGKFIIRANYKIYGDLAYIDASNPFELYWYYRDQQKLVFTDNQLSQRGVLDLSANSSVETGVVCRSFDNGLWVFDGSDAKLSKLNKEMKVLQESPMSATWTLRQWWPVKMVEDGKHVYVLDSALGIAIFDIFGQHAKIAPVLGVDDFQVRDGKILYARDGHIMRYDPILLTCDTLESGVQAIGFRIEKQRRYLRLSNGIEIRKFE